MNSIAKIFKPKNKKEPSKPTIVDVANWFLSKNAMSYKSLNALCYLAQCHHIGYDDNHEPLFDDDFEAHVGRPTNSTLLKLSEECEKNFSMYTGKMFEFNKDQIETLEMVWKEFGALDEYQLDNMSHDECFSLIRMSYDTFEPCTDIIPKDLIAAAYAYKIACVNLPEYEEYTKKIKEYSGKHKKQS